MDPVSQGTVGAVFAQSAANRETIRAYAIFGCLAGMAPDLDVFIQSSTDPLLFLEFHRHFTHSLVFIPFGALIVCAVLFRVWRHPLSFRSAYMACFIGYATHGLLDACTSYGTQLLWPFSNVRIAWNNVSVIDPICTIPLLVLAVLAARRKQRIYAIVGIAWLISYLLFGLWQHDRAIAAAERAALAQGHVPKRLTVKPGFANLILWKAIYEHEGRYHVDAVRVAADSRWCEGEDISKFDISRDLPSLPRNSQQAADIDRFDWFSDGYLATYGEPTYIIDIRYATVPNEVFPMWGIHIDPTARPDAHVRWQASPRATPTQMQHLWDLLVGKGCSPI